MINAKGNIRVTNKTPVGVSKIHLKNNCHELVRAPIRFKQVNGSWKTLCWYKVNPSHGYFAKNSNNNHQLLSTSWNTIYIYAESKGGIWDEGHTTFPNVQKTCGGESFSMYAKTYRQGDTNNFNVNFSCSKRRNERSLTVNSTNIIAGIDDEAENEVDFQNEYEDNWYENGGDFQNEYNDDENLVDIVE